LKTYSVCFDKPSTGADKTLRYQVPAQVLSMRKTRGIENFWNSKCQILNSKWSFKEGGGNEKISNFCSKFKTHEARFNTFAICGSSLIIDNWKLKFVQRRGKEGH